MAFTKKEKNILKKFGQKVREVRKEKGWTQEELAFKSELDRTYIGGIERGERNVSILNIEKIAFSLEVEPSVFFKIENLKNIK